MPGPDATDDLDRELLERMRLGDEAAFRELFLRYAPIARALAVRLIREPFLADEVLQEAFLSVWRGPAAFDGDRGSVRSWVMTIVHRRAVDLVRKEEAHRRKAVAAAVDPFEEVAGPETNAVEAVGIAAGREAVRSALASIPDEQRRIIEMMYFDGLSQSRVAEALQLPLGTVKSRTLLGMRKLRACLVTET